ncbi:ribonuclease 3-like protein 3 [Panicum miliaceum]|uniref:Ribonuclease 3-like protein 3 n=1 Tax=Panicum miliaceum TaxID=4540 RepID=A0A3L6RYT7_PANMI|nr:ribonuclease 3-like protein 3 [Panicum miliaceum]
MTAEDVAAVEAVLGYDFADKSLVELALTHGSFYPYRPGDTYERLEYLGDGVLTCLMSREVFRTYRTLPPGPLTRLRAANVDTEKLARVAVVRGLHRFLRHKAPQLEGQECNSIDKRIVGLVIRIMLVSSVDSDSPRCSSDDEWHVLFFLAGRLDPALDSNFDQEEVWRVFRNLADPLINLETLGKHPVSELFEFCQKTCRGVKIVKDEWDKNLKVEVLIDGELVGSATTYAQKKEIAQNRAAKAALDKLKETMGQIESESASADVSEPFDELDLAGILKCQ